MRISRKTLIFALALGACADAGPVSGPGTLTAVVVSPNGPEGAAVLSLQGDGVGALTPVGTTELYSHVESSAVQVVLINQSGGELSFEVAVADTTAPPSFALQEVAGPDDVLRTLTGYSVEFRR